MPSSPPPVPRDGDLPPIRVLIVDDSAVMRGLVGRMLDALPDFEVATTATNGRCALEALREQAARGRPVDVVVLDIEMPEMDGLTALPLILKQHPGTRVLMLSAHGGHGAEVTVRALALGAADFVCKPRASEGGAAAEGAPSGTGSRVALLDAHAADLTRKLRALGRSAQRVTRRLAQRQSERSAGMPAAPPALAAPSRGPAGGPAPVVPPVPAIPAVPAASAPVASAPVASAPAGARLPANPPAGGTLRRASLPMPRPAHVLAIASSTGGPVALADLLGALPPRLDVPVLIAQHMPPDFTRLLAERLSASSGHPCTEARAGDVLRPGHVYIAPGDHHMLVERRGGEVRVRLTQDPLVNHCRPAADPLFESVAAVYGPGVLAVVLTGMGHDGRDGAAAVVRRGGRVLAQDEASSVVWGMPGAVAQAGLAEAVLPIPQIATHVSACCGPHLAGSARAVAAPAAVAALPSPLPALAHAAGGTGTSDPRSR